MTPREKRRIALISVAVIFLAVLFLALYFIPTFVYFLFVLGIASVPFVYHTNDPPFYSREGHYPRPNLIIPPLIRRWLPAKTVNGVPSGGRVSGRVNRGRFTKGDSAGVTGETRLQTTGLYRRETELSTSLFSPRDILMGSYLGKPDSPSAVGRFGGAETRELRERLSRPNHAVQTPNRRLSFGDSVGTVGRFTITPQRHYPIAQPGCSPVGMLAPVQWHGYKKKNILTPRNSPRVHSPVTVKIARPDHSATRSPFFNHLSSPLAPGPLSMGLGAGTGAAADPCSRETVLSVLKESRKREVDDDEDRSFMDAQKSKRRRHGSSESSQSAFEPLTNGTPSHLVPKPGRMKRGMNTLAVEESQMKRSRTSSVSSLGSGLTPGGVPGSIRNPIYSSYSSSLGTAQQKKPSTLSLSPLSSPGSSRSQTPERPPKKPREEVAQSSCTAPTAKSDAKSADQAASTGKKSPEPMPVVTSPSGSGSSEGKRRRKVPLVPSRRGNISLPPAPELGYTITVMDLDLEKKAALEQIKKALEEPEPDKPAPASAAPVFPTVPAASAAAPSSGGLLLGSITSVSSFAAPTFSSATSFPNSGLSSTASTSSTAAPAPAPAASLPNPLLESLRKMKDSPSAAPAPHGMALTGISAPTPSLLSSGEVKLEPSATPAGPGATPAEPVPTPAQPVPIPAQPVPTPAQPVPTPAQPVPTMALPVQTPAQPVPTMALPVQTPAQPVPTPAEPVSTLAQPGPTPAQPGPMPAQPDPTPAQPGPTPAQPSPASAQPSSATAPAIQLPSSVSGSTFGQVLPQPALSSATLQPSTFSLASVVKPPSSSSSAAASTETPSDAVNPLPSAFKPIFGAASGAVPPSSTSASASATPTFKPIFGSVAGGSAFGQSQIAAPSAPTSSDSGSVFGSVSTTASTASEPALQTPAKSLFGSWSTAPGSSAAPTTNGSSFQFGAAPAASSAPALNPTSTTTPSHTPFQFGAAAASTAAPLSTQATFTFGAPSNQTSTAPTGAFSGFGTAASTATGPAPAGQPAFTFGKPSLEGPSTFSATPPAAPKPFAFGASGAGATATPFSFGAATTSTATFGTPSQSVFGGGTSGFSFGGTTGPSAVPAFGSSTQTSAPLPAPAPTFCFGGATASQPSAPAPSQATPLQPASGGFNFGAAVAGGAFGTPTPANPSCLTQNFNFGGASNAADGKPAFGTSTPAFGQNAGAPVQFGSPNFSPSTFGASPAPSFSIGSGSKPSGARQRLQARRQHPRKK